MPPIGRLAPTPSGMLHLGNICAFGAAWLSIRAQHGEILYRIEDVDNARARESIAEAQKEDLSWLGLSWDRETPRQSLRDYAGALEVLEASSYRCECSRKEIRANQGKHPRGCQAKRSVDGATRFELPQGQIAFTDRLWGPRQVDLADFDDPVLRRRDGVISYNLAVVADDIDDGVTEVVRGADLLEFTGVQIALWRALDAPPPTWLHGPLILGADGKKLSKSHGSTEIRALRDRGWSAEEVWRVVLPWLGIDDEANPIAAIKKFDPNRILRGPIKLSPDLD